MCVDFVLGSETILSESAREPLDMFVIPLDEDAIVSGLTGFTRDTVDRQHSRGCYQRIHKGHTYLGLVVNSRVRTK